MHQPPGRGQRAAGASAGLAPFGLGIGLSTGEVAAALLGSDERLEYTLVGDTVNLAQRLQDLARPAGTTVLSEADAAGGRADAVEVDTLGDQLVKGRETPVTAHRLVAVADPVGDDVPDRRHEPEHEGA